MSLGLTFKAMVYATDKSWKNLKILLCASLLLRSPCGELLTLAFSQWLRTTIRQIPLVVRRFLCGLSQQFIEGAMVGGRFVTALVAFRILRVSVPPRCNRFSVFSQCLRASVVGFGFYVDH